MMRLSLPMEPHGHRTERWDLLPYSPSQTASSTKKRFFRTIGILLAGLFLPVLLSSPLAAREDSARLVLRKTADLQKTKIYVVKKGDLIGRILRQQGDEPIPYTLFRKINPGIRNLNRIYPGQKILLPVRGITEMTESAHAIPPDAETHMTEYLIQEGDSISRIILSELNVNPAEALSTYRLVRELNPGIEDMNTLPAGQRLKLPANPARADRSAAAPVQTAGSEMDKPPTVAAAAKAPPSAEGLLGIIRPVISRMRGTLTATGNYYIPLKDSTQVAIDCSLIPVVELDDGSTVFLDFGNRLPDQLKGLISQSWPNYAFLPAGELSDDLTSLQGIINRSRNYMMYNAARPLTLTQKPEILVAPDWIIEGKKASSGTPYRQGLFLLGGNEQPFPAGPRTFVEKNGLIVTEISGGQAVVALTAQTAPPAIPDLRGLKGIPFAEQLLRALGETPVGNAEIVIFDQARHGFSLSVTADLLFRRGEKRFIIHAKKLPEQFVSILKEEGTEIVLIGERDSGRPLIEALLQGLQIPVSFGHFSYRIPEDGQRPRLTASFSALRAKAGGESLYLIDFDMSPDVISLLQGRPGGRFAKY
ncbi:MAG: hypothetical protein C0390_08950 [Syntrophus sp. (in: bacteria)]|nr:hypothetical protein [Syntrophus sp. (in: bacteria)]